MKNQKIDKENVLSKYIEENASEFVKTNPQLLTDSWISENSQFASLGSAVEGELLTLARQVREDKTLVFFYFHCKRLAFEIIPIYSDSNILNWPSFDSLIPDKSDLFLLLIALSAVPIIRKQHASMGVNS